MKPISKPIAGISLDLDNKWSYMKTHGDSRWSEFPSYLDILLPRVLAFLKERNLNITFFVVGQDAELSANASLFRMLGQSGHEIGNHSFHHEPWLHLYSEEQIEEEFARAEQAITAATGCVSKGFRGPGFSVSQTVIDVLAGRGYAYDASTLPTFLGPLARAYYLLTAKLTAEEREQRGKLFGSFGNGFRPLRPHTWSSPRGPIVEVPVTTIPIIRTPFHLSYLVYLSTFSKRLSSLYLSLALAACRMSGVAPSFLLHPLDFLGPEEAPELAFFPGMSLSLAHKLDVADSALRSIEHHFQLKPMRDHASAFLHGAEISAPGYVAPHVQ